MEQKLFKTEFKKTLKDVWNDLIDVSGKKAYKKFLFFLIMIDLTWFASVVADNLFGLNLGNYGESAWTFLFGAGLVLISNLKKLGKIAKDGFKAENLSGIVTFVVGFMALITSFLSLPQINIQNPVMNAVKGIIALIAIIYVVLEALVVKE